jgi:hypothetical protein
VNKLIRKTWPRIRWYELAGRRSIEWTPVYAGDGLPNLLKYALNLNPTVPAVSPVTMDLSTGYLRLTVPRNPSATDVTFSVEVNNTDLSNPHAWSSANTVVDQNTASILQVHDSVPVSQSSEQFIRLRITR